MLDVRRLRLLSELSRRGTIAEVASSVGYTPSAVSQSLARLEREAGVTLLERDGSRVHLTPAARTLVLRADRILAELDDAAAELASEQAEVRGPLVMGAFPTASAALVIPALDALRRRHPGLQCSLREHYPAEGIPLLRAGELDILISEGYSDLEPAPVGGLEVKQLLVEPLRVVLPGSGHPQSDPVALADLADRDWVAGPPGTQYAAAFEHACRAAGFAPRIAHRADEVAIQLALVTAGLAVALLPALAEHQAGAAAVRFVDAVPAPPARKIYALIRQGASRRPSVAAALSALRDQTPPV